MADGRHPVNSLEHLWAPWRSRYVSRAKELQGEGCLFCRLGEVARPEEHYRLFQSEEVMVVLNLFPYTTGHVMVAPRAHWSTPTQASEAAYAAFYRMVRYVELAIRSAYRPQGLNVGMNLGESAGAGVPHHFHMHLVPRYSGDTNFMTALAATRVHPESLDDTWAKLWPFFENGPLPEDDARWQSSQEEG